MIISGIVSGPEAFGRFNDAVISGNNYNFRKLSQV